MACLEGSPERQPGLPFPCVRKLKDGTRGERSKRGREEEQEGTNAEAAEEAEGRGGRLIGLKNRRESEGRQRSEAAEPE